MRQATTGILLLAGACAACSPAQPDLAVSVEACRAEPIGHVLVWIDAPGASGSRRFRGTVESLRPDDAYRALRIAVRSEGEDGTVAIMYRHPENEVPSLEGRRLRFQVETAGRFPVLSALVATDEEGIVFAAVSDLGPGRTVVREGLADLKVELLPSGCPDRPSGRCVDQAVNKALRVSLGPETVQLMHGETARLGPYRVVCLAAEEVVYSKNCHDAGQPSLSYTITRADHAAGSAAD